MNIASRLALVLVVSGCAMKKKPPVDVAQPPMPVPDLSHDVDEVWFVAYAPPTDAPSSGSELRLNDLTVHAAVDGVIASVQLDTRYGNDSEQAVAAHIPFPIPALAAVHDLVIEHDGRRIRAIVQDESTARELFASAQQRGLSAVLLQADQDEISAQLGTIDPGATIGFELAWNEVLRRKHGGHALGLHLPEQADNVDITVDISSPLPIAELGTFPTWATIDIDDEHHRRVRIDRLPGGEGLATWFRTDARQEQAFVWTFDDYFVIDLPEHGEVDWPASVRDLKVCPGTQDRTWLGRSDSMPDVLAINRDGMVSNIAVTSIDGDHSVARLWARGVIDDMSDDQGRRMAVRHGLVTPLTSLLVVDAAR